MKKFEKPHYKNGKFYNSSSYKTESFFVSSIIMFFKSLWLRFKADKDHIDNCSIKFEQPSSDLSCNKAGSKIDDKINTQVYNKLDNQVCNSENSHINSNIDNPVVTWIGHATFLIQIGGKNILTDPVLGQASFLYKKFYRRILKPGIPQDLLPNIDFVLISHNHMDHMDKESLLFLKNHKNISLLVPSGNKSWFDKRGFSRVSEYLWWESAAFKTDDNREIKFTFLPANHWSQRSFFDKNKTLWGSWMVQFSGKKIFFAGDTAYDSHFKEIAEYFSRNKLENQIDVALMPIGPCGPRCWVAHHHVDAKESIMAFLDLNAKHFVPMHWGTFPLGAEEFDLPIRMVKEHWQDFSGQGLLVGKNIYYPKAGENLKF